MSELAIKTPPVRSIVNDMAARYSMDRDGFMKTIRATVVPKEITDEQLAVFLLIAKDFNLNPFRKEIYAFPAKGGGITPIVSIDGWLKLINSQPEFDGMEFSDNVNTKGELVSITCRIYRRDRSRPGEVTEYMNECYRETDTWKKWPARMLRHKATIQAARYAFALTGIHDQDEAERMTEANVYDQTEVVEPGQSRSEQVLNRTRQTKLGAPPPPAQPQAPEAIVEPEPAQAVPALPGDGWPEAIRMPEELAKMDLDELLPIAESLAIEPPAEISHGDENVWRGRLVAQIQAVYEKTCRGALKQWAVDLSAKFADCTSTECAKLAIEAERIRKPLLILGEKLTVDLLRGVVKVAKKRVGIDAAAIAYPPKETE